MAIYTMTMIYLRQKNGSASTTETVEEALDDIARRKKARALRARAKARARVLRRRQQL